MIKVRVVRSNNLIDSAYSSRVMSLLSADGVTFSFFAAAVKLPSSTIKMNEARSGSREISLELTKLKPEYINSLLLNWLQSNRTI